MINLIELKTEDLKIIKEIGDLENIVSYPSKQVIKTKNAFIKQFKTEEDWKVIVEITTVKDNIFQGLKIPTNRENTYNVAYSVEDNQSQYTKTTYSKLIKILKTIRDIILEFANSTKNLEALLFFAANKNEDKLLTNTDSQKNNIYNAIIIRSISKLGSKWKLKNIEIGGSDFNGFVIYKPNNNNEIRK